MKREEIEHLLAAYASGEISAADRKSLEELFLQDPLLKQESEEMLQVWNSIYQTHENTVTPPAMDVNFYAMLEDEKGKQSSDRLRVIILKPSLIRLLIASAACIAAFMIGRISIQPEQITKYKTVYVKQQIPAPNVAVIAPLNKAGIKEGIQKDNKLFVTYAQSQANTELRQKLRSVYASERIAAITKLSTYKNLDPETLEIMKLALNEDPNANVRMMIVNVLQPLSNQPGIQNILIAALKQQQDPLIQTSIVDLLVDAKSQQAIPQMIMLLKSKNTDVVVQEKIKDGIEKFLY